MGVWECVFDQPSTINRSSAKGQLLKNVKELFQNRIQESLETPGLFPDQYHGVNGGMTACFLIFMYVRFELSYDKCTVRADRIYRIICDIKTPTETLKTSGPSWAVGPHLIWWFSAGGSLSAYDQWQPAGQKGECQISGAQYSLCRFFFFPAI